MQKISISQRKPAWLNKKIDLAKCHSIKYLLKDLNLNTICQEALCPNISECFSKGIATFLILGNICTRKCSFCSVNKGTPKSPDPSEPKRIKEAVERLKLKHVVITSVTRDDLSDGGANLFVATIDEIRKIKKHITIEVLVPDFRGNIESIKRVVNRKPKIFGHNIETVPRLYNKIRKGADYKRFLSVLKTAKNLDHTVYTKSGIMVGLGEKDEEVQEVFYDIKEANCDFLSIGQYLAPSRNHFPIKEYVTPSKFDYYKKEAEKLGFLYVASGPYIRSSFYLPFIAYPY